MTLDDAQLEEFAGRVALDLGAALHAVTVVIGDKLGLYATLADLGPSTPASLADATGCDTRLVQEWLAAQYAAGYCHHSAATGAYWLGPEQAAVLTDPGQPACMIGGMTVAVATAKDEEAVRHAFRTGSGLAWSDHHHDLFHGTEALFKPGYVGNLVQSWIPALDGVTDVLTGGGTVADVGCGHGASTILLAQAFPEARIVGFDSHAASVEVAGRRAGEAGVADRVRFEVASAQDFTGGPYDLVCVFDSLHDMGDPLSAARHVRGQLGPDGTWMVVEPMAGETVTDNANPVGRIFYAASTTICTPAAQAQQGPYALGNQVPERTWAEIVADAGFSRFRRATETPLNRVFEIRP